MRVCLYDAPDKVSDGELQGDLLLLPAWRQAQVLAYRHLADRVQCAKAYLLLRQCLAEEYGIYQMPNFKYREYGKPMLSFPHGVYPQPSIHFNLSHCSKGVMCVVDEEPVGCDIEAIPPTLDADLLSACFSEAEQSAILTAEQPNVVFVQLWTRKEALLKLHGLGLVDDDLPCLLTSPLASDVTFHTTVSVEKGYVYTTAKRK